MANRAKVAVSLDERLLQRVERIRTRTGESRSALVARALALVTEHDARAEQIRRYQEAYREHPETGSVAGVAHRVARRALAALPWEEE